jgi:putative ABC transport system substrate-binding protein
MVSGVKRRLFGVVMGGALAWPIVGRGQPRGRVYRVGLLRPTGGAVEAHPIHLALLDLGYVDGQNLIFEERFADNQIAKLPELGRELVALPADLIVTVGSAATLAVRDASTKVPIVMFGNFDPVAAGLVTNLARPGGNITGILISSEGTLGAKRLELLKEAVPHMRRVALLAPADSSVRRQVQEVEKAAISLNMDLVIAEVRQQDYEQAFNKIKAAQVDALFVAATSQFVYDRNTIIALASKHRLPAIYEWPDQVRAGGLMAYGTSRADLYSRIATYIDRILKGANPGDLPIELPAKFGLAINMATAKALGLTLPAPLLSRADELIE